MKNSNFFSLTKVSFLGVMLLSSLAFAQYPGQVQVVGRSENTVIRTWLYNSTIQWEPTTTSFEVVSGRDISQSVDVNVEQVQTNLFRREVVLTASHNVWEVMGQHSARDPDCENLRQQDPSGQKRECPFVLINDYGWKFYPEQTGEQEADSQRSTIQRKPIALSVKLSGQVLRDYEKETLVVQVDENAQVRASVQNAKNKYQIQGGATSSQSARVAVQGLGRNLSLEDGALPEDIFSEKGSPHVYQSGDQPNRIFIKFRLSDQVFDSQYEPNTKLKVTYQLEQTNGLGKSNSSFKQVASREVQIDPANQKDFEVDLWGAGRGRRVRAKLFFNFLGSEWYSSRTIETAAEETTAK